MIIQLYNKQLNNKQSNNHNQITNQTKGMPMTYIIHSQTGKTTKAKKIVIQLKPQTRKMLSLIIGKQLKIVQDSLTYSQTEFYSK